MRTTLDIEDDVLAMAKQLARLQGTSAGEMVSRRLLVALSGTASLTPSPSDSLPAVAGFRPFPARAGQLVTHEKINLLRDEAGL